MAEENPKKGSGDEKLDPLQYEPDGEGGFVKKGRGENESVNVAMEQAWEEVEARVDRAREEVKQGKKSPLAFYMELFMMDPKMLAQYMGIGKWKVKRHLRPKGFRKLDDDSLNAYAELFGVSKEELRDPDLSRTASPYNGPE